MSGGLFQLANTKPRSLFHRQKQLPATIEPFPDEDWFLQLINVEKGTHEFLINGTKICDVNVSRKSYFHESEMRLTSVEAASSHGNLHIQGLCRSHRVTIYIDNCHLRYFEIPPYIDISLKHLKNLGIEMVFLMLSLNKDYIDRRKKITKRKLKKFRRTTDQIALANLYRRLPKDILQHVLWPILNEK